MQKEIEKASCFPEGTFWVARAHSHDYQMTLQLQKQLRWIVCVYNTKAGPGATITFGFKVSSHNNMCFR